MATKTSSRVMALIAAGLALTVIIIGLVFFLIARHGEQRALAMRTWPSTSVTITSCAIGKIRPSGETQDQDQLVTSYEWSVNGHRYESTSTELLGWSSTDHTSAVHHKAGDTLTAIYDPQDPQDMVPGGGEDDRTPFVLKVIPWVLFALSLPFWWLALRFLRSKAAA
jgi:Protein of unknown function (DUF3592)